MRLSRYLTSQICLLTLSAKIKFSRKFPDLQYSDRCAHLYNNCLKNICVSAYKDAGLYPCGPVICVSNARGFCLLTYVISDMEIFKDKEIRHI